MLLMYESESRKLVEDGSVHKLLKAIKSKVKRDYDVQSAI